jgi:hypothetical protein
MIGACLPHVKLGISGLFSHFRLLYPKVFQCNFTACFVCLYLVYATLACMLHWSVSSIVILFCAWDV